MLTLRTPIGRKARPSFLTQATPLIRTKPKDLVAAGVTHVERIGSGRGRSSRHRGRAGARRGQRGLEHGLPPRLLVDRPPRARRPPGTGARAGESSPKSRACTSSVSRAFSVSSATVTGVGRTARRVTKQIDERPRTFTSASASQAVAASALKAAEQQRLIAEAVAEFALEAADRIQVLRRPRVLVRLGRKPRATPRRSCSPARSPLRARDRASAHTTRCPTRAIPTAPATASTTSAGSHVDATVNTGVRCPAADAPTTLCSSSGR